MKHLKFLGYIALGIGFFSASSLYCTKKTTYKKALKEEEKRYKTELKGLEETKKQFKKIEKTLDKETAEADRARVQEGYEVGRAQSKARTRQKQLSLARSHKKDVDKAARKYKVAQGQEFATRKFRDETIVGEGLLKRKKKDTDRLERELEAFKYFDLDVNKATRTQLEKKAQEARIQANSHFNRGKLNKEEFTKKLKEIDENEIVALQRKQKDIRKMKIENLTYALEGSVGAGGLALGGIVGTVGLGAGAAVLADIVATEVDEPVELEEITVEE